MQPITRSALWIAVTLTTLAGVAHAQQGPAPSATPTSTTTTATQPAPPTAPTATAAATTTAGAAATPSLREQAAAAYKAQDWERAIPLFQQLVAAQPGDGQAWHDLGYCLHSAGRYEEGLVADRRGAEVAAPGTRVQQTSAYNVACALAMLGRTEEALAALQRAVAAGFRNPESMEYDPELASLLHEPRFLELLAGLRAGRTKVAIIVHDHVELLDFAGPAEVFTQARGPDGTPRYEVMLVGLTHDPVRAQGVGGSVVPQYALSDCPAPDIVVVPGGDTRVLEQSEAFMAWIPKVAAHADVMMSVCTGAFVFARTGLLDGLVATTHKDSIAELRRDFPGLDVREGVRFVDNGRIVTTAGISAGIDGALEVVSRQVSREAAARAAANMEYAWHPE